MKTNKILIMLSLGLAIGFASCEKEGALTPNPKYLEVPVIPGGNDTTITDTTNGGGGGDTTSSGGGQPPAGFMAATTVNKRVALLEDFTGVRCQYCPAGHDVAVNIKNTMGSKFIVMAVHGGTYATPAPGWMDFNTAFAQALIDQSKVSGYPAGQMNRLPAGDLGSTAQKPADNGMAMGRGEWSNAANAAANLNAPVNIGAKAKLVGSNLTVDVDLYYTATEAAGNSINVALLQSGISSNQSIVGGPNTGQPGYIQNHVLRDFITGQWGETVTTSTEKDHFVRRTYNYTIPADYNGSGPDGGGPVVTADMKVVVFVTRGTKDVLNAIEVAIQ